MGTKSLFIVAYKPYSRNAVLRRHKGLTFCLLRSFPLAAQRYILLVPFKGINAADVVLYAFVLYKAGRCHVVAVIDGKQHLLVIPVRRREYFLAGQLAEICLHVQSKGFCYLCCVAVSVWDITFDIDIDFLVFHFHSGFPLYRRRAFCVVLIQHRI